MSAECVVLLMVGVAAVALFVGRQFGKERVVKEYVPIPTAQGPYEKDPVEAVIKSLVNEPGRWKEGRYSFTLRRNDGVEVEGFAESICKITRPYVSGMSCEQRKRLYEAYKRCVAWRLS